MPHIRPSWLMCDALVNSLMFLDDAPQTIDQIRDHTDLRRDVFEQHLIIFRAWLLVSRPAESTYKLTSRGRALVDALRRFDRHTPFYNFTPGELLGLICADENSQTSNAITRIARVAFEHEIEGLRALRRSLDLLAARRCMTTTQDGTLRTRYARTARGASLLRQTLARWNVVLQHLPEHAHTRDLYIDLTLLPTRLHPAGHTPRPAAARPAAPQPAAPQPTPAPAQPPTPTPVRRVGATRLLTRRLTRRPARAPQRSVTLPRPVRRSRTARRTRRPATPRQASPATQRKRTPGRASRHQPAPPGLT